MSIAKQRRACRKRGFDAQSSPVIYRPISETKFPDCRPVSGRTISSRAAQPRSAGQILCASTNPTSITAPAPIFNPCLDLNSTGGLAQIITPSSTTM